MKFVLFRGNTVDAGCACNRFCNMDRKDMRERLQQVLEQYAKSPNWTPRQEIRQPMFWKSVRAEFIGSLILIVFSSHSDPYIGPVSYGCTVAILSYSFKATSSYFNPVISFAALLLRSVTPFRCCSLILAQTIGTISGATVISLGLASNSTSVILPELHVNPAKGFGYEFFGSLVVILVMAAQLEKSTDYDPLFPLMTGLTVGTASSLARLGTGGFLNPIRASSLALFQDCWSHHYIYWVGPILGTLLAVFTFDFIRPSRTKPKPDSTAMTTSDSRAVNLSTIVRSDIEFTQQETDITQLATLS
ncbi:aquaporin-6-like [Paramacrobiotus metropolitanus]|uniref:aquaporin-6-like n=1 Tax=Paramacrobiotus metropolitanus TaxID=2943436 RepID=UPI002445D98C|nr:aquaporin-6-like [Paramacrobiotus metropolitanus]